MPTLLNFMKIYKLVQKLLVGGDTDTQHTDVISLTSISRESRLEGCCWIYTYTVHLFILISYRSYMAH